MPICPYCKSRNERWVVPDIAPGEPYRDAPHHCEHYVFASINDQPSGADYAHEILYLDIYNNNPSGRPGMEVSAGILEILRRHLAFDKGMGFAGSEENKKAARTEVSTSLRSAGFAVADEAR